VQRSLVDLDAHWALFRMGKEVVVAWEVGVGKPGSETPVGEYVTGEKTKEPPWFRPGHAPVPYGDPENPLGTRWIAWQKADGSNTGLGFHGTKDPSSIGEDLSQGCVRMRQSAIEELFEILPKGAAITVQP
jgi:lipoprotein-anchoring transpeptidase ErfK/SrfK